MGIIHLEGCSCDKSSTQCRPRFSSPQRTMKPGQGWNAGGKYQVAEEGVKVQWLQVFSLGSLAGHKAT